MTKSLILGLAAAAAFAATSSVGPTAEAGGLRLGFGFPLGSFTAHPTPGYGDSSYGASKHCAKTAPVFASTQSSGRASAKVAHKKPDSSETRVASYSKSKEDTKSVSRIETDAKPLATPAASPAATGSAALAASPTASPETTTLAAVSETETIDVVPAPVATKAGTAGEDNSTPAADTPVVAAANTGCKKFIPAVGVTISVDCPK